MSDSTSKGEETESRRRSETEDSIQNQQLPPENLPEELIKRRLARLDTRRALAELCKTVPGLDEMLLPRGIQADALTRKSGGSAQMLRGLSRRIKQDVTAWGAFRTAVGEQIPPETFDALENLSQDNLDDLSSDYTTGRIAPGGPRKRGRCGRLARRGANRELAGRESARGASGFKRSRRQRPRRSFGKPQKGERTVVLFGTGRQRAGGGSLPRSRGANRRARGYFLQGIERRAALQGGNGDPGTIGGENLRARASWRPPGTGSGERAQNLRHRRRTRRSVARRTRTGGCRKG